MIDIPFGDEFAQAHPPHPAFREGAIAHKDGNPFEMNPYPPGEDHKQWDDGWKESEYAHEHWNDP